MSKEPIDYLKHIADECAYIVSVSANLTKDELMDDETWNKLFNCLERYRKQDTRIEYSNSRDTQWRIKLPSTSPIINSIPTENRKRFHTKKGTTCRPGRTTKIICEHNNDHL